MDEQLSLSEKLQRRTDDFHAVGKLLKERDEENRRLKIQLDASAARIRRFEAQRECDNEVIASWSSAYSNLEAEYDLLKQRLREKAPSLLSQVAVQAHGPIGIHDAQQASTEPLIRIAEACELISPRHVTSAGLCSGLHRSYDGAHKARLSPRMMPPITLGARSGGAWLPHTSQVYATGSHPCHEPARTGTPRASMLTSAMLAEATGAAAQVRAAAAACGQSSERSSRSRRDGAAEDLTKTKAMIHQLRASTGAAASQAHGHLAPPSVWQLRS